MLMYALIGLSLVLVGVVGLQFSYLFYADRIDAERRRHVVELENKCASLSADLEFAEQRLAEQSALIKAIEPVENEMWADIIEER